MGRSHTFCRWCRRGFLFEPSHHKGGEPDCCGRPACRARRDYSPEDWAGQARMAAARQAAGVPLNDLDREALRRVVRSRE